MSLLIGERLLLFGHVGAGDGFTDAMVRHALAEHGSGPVTAILGSAGGDFGEALRITERLLVHPHPVRVVVHAYAHGAAAAISMGGSDVWMLDGATLDLGGLFAAEEPAADLARGLAAMRMRRSTAEARALVAEQPRFSAAEALAIGLVDRIGGLDRSDTDAAFERRLAQTSHKRPGVH